MSALCTNRSIAFWAFKLPETSLGLELRLGAMNVGSRLVVLWRGLAVCDLGGADLKTAFWVLAAISVATWQTDQYGLGRMCSTQSVGLQRVALNEGFRRLSYEYICWSGIRTSLRRSFTRALGH